MKNLELTYIISPSPTLEIVGAVERKFAHTAGLWHLTVLILAVRKKDNKIIVQVRSPMKRTFPNAIDIFGGHCAVAAELAAALAGHHITATSIVIDTAVREANEELRLVDSAGCPIVVTAAELQQVGDIGEFEMDTPKNREKSSLFIYGTPAGATLHPMDEQDGVHEPVRHEFLSLDELLAIQKAGKPQIADGLGRVLKRASDCAEFKHEIEKLISEVASIA